MKFIVSGTIEIEVTATIEADSRKEAEEMLDGADCCAESCDSSVVFSECSQSRSSVDEITCPAEKKFEDMTTLERAIVLKDNGVEDGEALEAANEDSIWDIDEDWQGYFDE